MKDPFSLTQGEAVLVLRLLRALQKALESVEVSSDLDAQVSLRQAKDFLSQSTKNRKDVPTTTSMFLGRFSSEDRKKIVDAFEREGLCSLSLFGARAPERIRLTFERIGLECPVALMQFNAAYRRELELAKSVISTLGPPSQQ